MKIIPKVNIIFILAFTITIFVQNSHCNKFFEHYARSLLRVPPQNSIKKEIRHLYARPHHETLREKLRREDMKNSQYMMKLGKSYEYLDNINPEKVRLMEHYEKEKKKNREKNLSLNYENYQHNFKKKHHKKKHSRKNYNKKWLLNKKLQRQYKKFLKKKRQQRRNDLRKYPHHKYRKIHHLTQKILRSKKRQHQKMQYLKSLNHRNTPRKLKQKKKYLFTESNLEKKSETRNLKQIPNEKNEELYKKEFEGNIKNEEEDNEKHFEVKENSYYKIQNLDLKNPVIDYDLLNSKKDAILINFKYNDTNFDSEKAILNLKKLMLMLEECRTKITPLLNESPFFNKILVDKTPGCMTKLALNIIVINNIRLWTRNILYNYIMSNSNIMKINNLLPVYNFDSKKIDSEKELLTYGLLKKAIKMSEGTLFDFDDYKVTYKTRVDHLIFFFENFFSTHYPTLLYFTSMVNSFGISSILCNFYSMVTILKNFKKDLIKFEKAKVSENTEVEKTVINSDFDKNIEHHILRSENFNPQEERVYPSSGKENWMKLRNHMKKGNLQKFDNKQNNQADFQNEGIKDLNHNNIVDIDPLTSEHTEKTEIAENQKSNSKSGENLSTETENQELEGYEPANQLNLEEDIEEKTENLETNSNEDNLTKNENSVEIDETENINKKTVSNEDLKHNSEDKVNKSIDIEEKEVDTKSGSEEIEDDENARTQGKGLEKSDQNESEESEKKNNSDEESNSKDKENDIIKIDNEAELLNKESEGNLVNEQEKNVIDKIPVKEEDKINLDENESVDENEDKNSDEENTKVEDKENSTPQLDEPNKNILENSKVPNLENSTNPLNDNLKNDFIEDHSHEEINTPIQKNNNKKTSSGTSLDTSSDTSDENKTPIPTDSITNPLLTESNPLLENQNPLKNIPNLNELSNPLLKNISNPILNTQDPNSKNPIVINNNHFYSPNGYPYIPLKNNKNPQDSNLKNGEPIYEENQIPIFEENQIPDFNPNKKNPGLQTYYMNNNGGSPILVTNEIVDDYDENYKTPDQFLKKKKNYPKLNKEEDVVQTIPIHLPQQAFSVNIPDGVNDKENLNPLDDESLEDNFEDGNLKEKKISKEIFSEENENIDDLPKKNSDENIEEEDDESLEKNGSNSKEEEPLIKDELETPIDEVDDLSENVEDNEDKPFYPIDTAHQHHEIVVKDNHKINVTVNHFNQKDDQEDEFEFVNDEERKKIRKIKKKIKRKLKRKMKRKLKKERELNLKKNLKKILEKKRRNKKRRNKKRRNKKRRKRRRRKIRRRNKKKLRRKRKLKQNKNISRKNKKRRYKRNLI